MATPYETAAKQNGEIRIYLETETPIDFERIRMQLGYPYAYERPHSAAGDPFDYAFGDPRAIGSEEDFVRELARVAEIFSKGLGQRWTVELLYYAPGSASAIYHWSSAEETLHPHTVADEQ